METTRKTYERGRFVCVLTTHEEPLSPVYLTVSNKSGARYYQGEFDTEAEAMRYLEQTYFEIAQNEAKPYKVKAVELDNRRDWRDAYCIPEVDGGGIAYFDTLDEAIDYVKEVREDPYSDAIIIGENVPQEYKYTLRAYTW